jgi:hypothetical protein
MAHPYHKHREHRVSHARVKRILKAEGGDVSESVRQQGLARLKTKFQQEDAPKWIDAEGKDAQTTAGLVRRTSDNPYTQGK